MQDFLLGGGVGGWVGRLVMLGTLGACPIEIMPLEIMELEQISTEQVQCKDFVLGEMYGRW